MKQAHSIYLKKKTPQFEHEEPEVLEENLWKK